jgi:His-Xaa-Ser system protein HxsD
LHDQETIMPDAETVLELDVGTYSADAILATSYWFAKNIIIKTVQSSPQIILSIRSRDSEPITQKTIDEILVRLTDEELRYRLRQRFAAIETSIVQAAFAPAQTAQDHHNK